MVFPSQLLRKEINFIEGELKAAEGYSLRIGLDVKNWKREFFFRFRVFLVPFLSLLSFERKGQHILHYLYGANLQLEEVFLSHCRRMLMIKFTVNHDSDLFNQWYGATIKTWNQRQWKTEYVFPTAPQKMYQVCWGVLNLEVMPGLVPATSFCDGAQYGNEEGRWVLFPQATTCESV